MSDMTPTQFNLIYDVLSFSLATMMATTIFCWMRVPSIAEQYKSALIISGLVTFIASYHYFRIFNSWTEAYAWSADGESLTATGVPFNDAYRYMDWLLTVPLLLVEIILVMNLSEAESSSKATTLGVASAAMIILGYPGELVLSGTSTRWMYWGAAMLPFLYIVFTLLVGLSGATDSESDPRIAAKIKMAQVWTVISWCTYPIVYLFPMFGIEGSNVICAIQMGYSISDIISKCGVGLLICSITVAKSAAK